MSPLFGGGHLRLLGFGLLVVTFIVGALSGAALDRVLTADETGRVERERDRDGGRRSYIIDRVDMSDAQRAEIDAILKRRAERMRSIWHEVSPRMDAISDSARIEIMQVLTPEQRAEYEQRLEERARARERRGHPAGADGKP